MMGNGQEKGQKDQKILLPMEKRNSPAYDKTAHPTSNTDHIRYPRSQLRNGNLAAHAAIRLMLLSERWEVPVAMATVTWDGHTSQQDPLLSYHPFPLPQDTDHKAGGPPGSCCSWKDGCVRMTPTPAA